MRNSNHLFSSLVLFLFFTGKTRVNSESIERPISRPNGKSVSVDLLKKKVHVPSALRYCKPSGYNEDDHRLYIHHRVIGSSLDKENRQRLILNDRFLHKSDRLKKSDFEGRRSYELFCIGVYILETYNVHKHDGFHAPR